MPETFAPASPTASSTHLQESLARDLRRAVERSRLRIEGQAENAVTAEWSRSAWAFEMPRSPDDVEATPPIAADEIENHRGEWVILHQGHVVAHDRRPDLLFGDPRAVRADYTLYLVPHTQRRIR
jgi:hypothetical protein